MKATYSNNKVNFSNGAQLDLFQVQSIFNNRSNDEVREYLKDEDGWDEEMIEALIEFVEENR